MARLLNPACELCRGACCETFALDLRAVVRKEAIAKALHGDALAARALEKEGGAAASFPRALGRRGEHDPIDVDRNLRIANELENQAAGPDLDQVDDRHPQWQPALRCEAVDARHPVFEQTVHRTTAPAAPLLPVIVYLHGGGFILGSGANPSTAPEPSTFVLQARVVFVTLNYR